jgi:hypothetical protein
VVCLSIFSYDKIFLLEPPGKKMQIRESSINRISDHLGRIKHQVSLRNSIHLYDINIHSEEFFKDLLNRIYGYKLENLNDGYAFTESIDLADSSNGIAFQVTSDKSKKKIVDTVESFYENGTIRDYPTLKILLLGDKPKRHESILLHRNFKFDLKTDVVDFSDLLRAIQKLDATKIHEIEQWIDSELTSNRFGSYMPPTNSDFDKYFNKFLNNEIDSNILFFNAQPSLADCREVFSDEYYLLVHQIYSVFYFSMLDKGNNMNDKLRDKDIYHFKGSSLGDIENQKHNLPAGMATVVERKAFRPGKLQYYSISFTKRDAQHGITFNMWVFLNGRWFFFPKPWQVVRGIYELRNNKGLKTMISIMKFFGLRVKEGTDLTGVFATTVLLSELTKK